MMDKKTHDISLAHYASQRITKSNPSQALELWCMAGAWTASTLWQHRDKNTQRRSWLLLVAQANTLNEAANDNESTKDTTVSDSNSTILVAGVTAYEYRHTTTTAGTSKLPKDDQSNSATSFYIEKVDTTGYASSSLTERGRPSIAAAMVLGIMDYAQALGDQLRQTIHVHVFARAQPQYLFANSATNPTKHPLDDRGLLRWWLRTINAHTTNTTSDKDTSVVQHKWRKYWLVPGYTPSELGSWARPPNAPLISEWKYGVPYSAHESAHKAFPEFPDDPIGRMLRSKASIGLDVTSFLALLSVGEECGAGKPAGVFTLDYTPISSDTIDIPQCNEEDKDTLASSSDCNDTVYTKTMDWLMQRADFVTREAAIKATDQLKTICSKNNYTPCQIEATTSTSVVVAVATTDTTTSTSSVNNLQGMIKRKQPPSTLESASSPTVNNLQGLIKRRKPTSN
ncbi:histone acetylation protein-domain-containing protein [Syncephalis plumigaleata]|nr:histone acetylation protein-domain-containing protein [Syncephalis plumigaleata]